MNKTIKLFWESFKILYFTLLAFIGLGMLACEARKGYWWLHFISALFLFIFTGWLISTTLINWWKIFKTGGRG